VDKAYWENYYKSPNLVKSPSSFAEFCLRNYLKPHNKLLELGCGNGRDSVFFAENKIHVDAIDQCEAEMDALSKKNALENLKFIAADFTNLKTDSLYDAIYSRFSIHAITLEEEMRVLKWCGGHIKADGYFFIEIRGKENKLFGMGKPVENFEDTFILDGHARRFIDFEVFKSRLISNEFKIDFGMEDFGFAPFPGMEDEKFIRVVAKKL
jgi:cyclopropane fatty-acyl-phospholipid synthase-like methyltransferase